MPDSKITALASTGTGTDPANDPLVIVDVSDTSMAATGTTKKVTLNQLLATSPTATLASATITGDLTVRTTGLILNTSGLGVGITPSSFGAGYGTIQVSGATGSGIKLGSPTNGAYIYSDASFLNITTETNISHRFFVNNLLQHKIDQLGVFNWYDGAGGTRMTLNANGLGVGAGPASKLYVYGANVSGIGQFRIDCPAAGVAQQTFAINGVGQGNIYHDGSQFVIGSVTSTPLFLRTANTVAVTIDASQNVGIGVTPSAWGTYKGLQVGYASLAGYAGSDTLLGSNVYFDGGAFRYISTATASSYRQLSGVHSWNIAGSGTAGNAITFTQAMTLDASGRLLVGKTTSGFTAVGAEIRENGEVIQTIAASTDATFVSKVYSSTAAAYRFYVGLGGTVFATNTTISAISDARLKENVQDLDVGLGAILALKPRKFDWKEGKGKNIKGDRGFIAQEFETVFPQLVDEWADPAPEGEAPYKSVRQDLIPVLVKAIQELTARVQTLEAK